MDGWPRPPFGEIIFARAFLNLHLSRPPSLISRAVPTSRPLSLSLPPPPSQLWPYLSDLHLYANWTNLVSAKCETGCKETGIPAPGDKLTVSVVIFVDKPKIPAAVVPLAKVEEIITNGTCTGLPGKCLPPTAEYLATTGGKSPLYRIAWGPNYAGLFAYHHYFDLLSDGNGGTLFYHWERYTGLAGLLFGESLLAPLFNPTVQGQNADMLAFAEKTFNVWTPGR